MKPTLVFLQHELPSQVAQVVRFPLTPWIGLTPIFPYNRPCRHFRLLAVSCSHTLRIFIWMRSHGLKETGYSGKPVLVVSLALAPDVQISLHRAQTSKFSMIGDHRAWGVAPPGRIARRSKTRWLYGWRPPSIPVFQVSKAIADRREQLPHLRFAKFSDIYGIATLLNISVLPPSFDCLYSRALTVVA